MNSKGGSGTRSRRRQASFPISSNQGQLDTNNPMLKDEEANLDLAKAHVPSEIQDFLKEIAFPPAEEENEEEKPSKINLKGIKSRVDTGSFKGRNKNRTQGNDSADSSYNSDSGSKQDGEETSDAEETSKPIKKRIARSESKFTEYEMALLWSQYKDKFPGDRMNHIQLNQMLRHVFPRCDNEQLDEVVSNIMIIFDPHEVGTISFRDLMISFSLSMKGPLKDRLQWSYRLYDTEGDGNIDKDDLVKTIIRLCEFTKTAHVYWQRGGPKYVKEKQNNAKIQEEPKPASTPVKKEKKKDLNKNEDGLGNVKILSNKMGERVGATKKKRNERIRQPKKEKEVEVVEEVQPKFNAELDDEEKQRAVEVVKYLDLNGDGYVSKEEFVQGCLDDEEFFGIASSFQGHLIWGSLF